MARKSRQSLNSSVVTVTNNSILEDSNNNTEFEYVEFVKRFGRLDLDEELNVDLIGSEDNIALVEEKIINLLGVDKGKGSDKKVQGPGQDFALITGPSGTGKTTVVRSLAQNYSKNNNPSLSFFYLKASWTLEKQFGNPESQLRLLFDEAIKKQPSLVFIDKIDLICSEKRSQSDAKDRVFNVLEDKFESLRTMGARVLVLAATERPEVLDPQIRKPSYFSEEIRFGLPKREDRVEYLKRESQRQKSSKDCMTDDQISLIADNCHCYTFEDLRKLCNVALKCNNNLSFDAFKFAQAKFKPVAIKKITTPCPRLSWNDIGGVQKVKKELVQSVIWPLKHRDKFIKLGIKSNKGALLYGPPGCSKTMLAQALATESGYNFISVKGPELFSKYVGDSEAAVRKLYRGAREIAPCIIFFDEIDGFATERSESNSSSTADKVVAQLLTELNGVEPLDNVFTIAATNRPDRVDRALLRPGRLDPSIYIPLPGEEDRREIFEVCMRGKTQRFDEPLDIVIARLVKLTEGYSGAEIDKICQEAGVMALNESLDNEHRELRHFMQALERVKPGTSLESLKVYDKFLEKTLREANGGISGGCKNIAESSKRKSKGLLETNVTKLRLSKLCSFSRRNPKRCAIR